MSNPELVLEDSSSFSGREQIGELMTAMKDSLEGLQGRVAKKHQMSFIILLDHLATLSSLITAELGVLPNHESSSHDQTRDEHQEEPTYKEPESGRYIFEGFAPLDEIISVITSLNAVSGVVEQAREAHSFFDKESQDYLHALELLDLEQDKLEEVVFRLAEARRNRRIVESFTKLCEPFNDLVQKNQSFLHALIRVKSQMVKTKNMLDSRKYMTKVAKDLQPDFDGRGSQKPSDEPVYYSEDPDPSESQE